MIENLNISSSSFVSKDCIFNGNVTIGKNCTIISSELSNTQIGDNCTIKHSEIYDSIVGNENRILHSVIEESQIFDNIQIGPFSHLRPKSIVQNNAKIGNFVELKNCKIGEGTKVPHLSYVGDATLGNDCNIGCGVIFCNYDGMKKSQSKIGNRVFVGSNSNIVAPVQIEDDAFVAAGSTITQDVLKNEFAIGRSRQENKKYISNPYTLKFKDKLKYFGTDGIRGIHPTELSDDLCTKIGYSIAKLKSEAKILIGRDTRVSGPKILENIAQGLIAGKATVFDAGIISTAGLAYLTKTFGFDYGIEITASHNPSEYNGIKIFDSKGYKINENVEHIVEENLSLPTVTLRPTILPFDIKPYLKHLMTATNTKLTGKKVLIDLSNGAISGYAKQIFDSLGAELICINDGGEINKNASVLNEEIFKQNMEKYNCDIGFAFDGDADRVMCMTKNLKLIDGDKIMLILTNYFNQKNAVGTIMTNMAIEKYLAKQGVNLIRTDVGDKYIAKIIKQKKYLIGAEQSGHVIISSLTTTGDGVLTALILCEIYSQNPNLFDQIEKIDIFPTINKKVKVKDKNIIKNPLLQKLINQEHISLNGTGRIIVRPSGTEPVIRITVECSDEETAKLVAEKITKFIDTIS